MQKLSVYRTLYINFQLPCIFIHNIIRTITNLGTYKAVSFRRLNKETFLLCYNLHYCCSIVIWILRGAKVAQPPFENVL